MGNNSSGTELPPDTAYIPSNFRYIKNNGQLIATNDSLRPDIKYYMDDAYPKAYFTDDTLFYVFSHIDTVAATTDSMVRLDVTYLNANNTNPVAQNVDSTYLNYFLAHCPTGVVNVPQYQRLTYGKLYQEIDLVYAQNTSGIKFAFNVHPHAKPDVIRARYNGTDSVKVLGGGELRIYTPLGNLTFNAPHAFQVDSSGNTITRSCEWYVDNDTEVIFTFPVGHNGNLPLIIVAEQNSSASGPSATDNLKWTTYYGGNGEEFTKVRAGTTGGTYITGYTQNNGFPFLNAIQAQFGGGGTDMVILKFKPGGVREWATYYGGNGDDLGRSINVDNSGNIYVTGYAGQNFPLFNPGGGAYTQSFGGNYDMAIVKLNSAGNSQLWAAYYGGSGNDYGNDLVIDNDGYLYVVGDISSASSTTLYTQSGAVANSATGQGLICKFQTDGVPLWITRFGGTATTTSIHSVCLDSDKDVIIGGIITSGTGFPIQNNGANGTYGGGTSDGFLTKIANHSSNNALIWSTYFGGNGAEKLNDIDVDANDNIYITGLTGSTSGFPLTDPAGSTDHYQGTYGGGTEDAYIAEFSDAGVRLWSTYFGDSDNENGYGLTLDSDGNIYVTGRISASSLIFPTTNLANGYVESYNGSTEGFLLAFNPALHYIWGTYFGGNAVDLPYSLATYQNSKLFMVGGTSSTASFPVENLNGAYNQGSIIGFNNGYISEFDLSPVIISSVSDISSAIGKDILVFPNPSQDVVNISLNLSKQSNVTITLVNVLGQQLMAENIKNATGVLTKQLPVNKLATGMYIVNVTVDGKITSKKIIKQ